MTINYFRKKVAIQTQLALELFGFAVKGQNTDKEKTSVFYS